MRLDIQNNQLIIVDDTNTIDSVCKSQLLFWNLKFSYLENTYSTEIDKQLFIKILGYFKKEGLEFELGTKATEFLQQIKFDNLNFETLKEKASYYKKGNFNKLDFEYFKEFVAANIKRPLKIHQLKAAYHLYLLGNAANFSVPGSGKTSVVLTVYEKLRIAGKVNTLLVVGPSSSFGPWKNEFIETLGRQPYHHILAGINKYKRKNYYFDTSDHKAELYLTSFQTALSDKKEIYQFLKQKHINVFLVVDEAHYIKQIKGNWAQAILQISEKALYRCVLTGTPMPKSYTDIFNLFDFLWPNQHPISSSDKTKVKILENHGNTKKAKQILEENVGPLFYRVRKSDLRLTPQNFIAPYSIEMGKYERRIYDAIYQKIKNYSQKEYFKNIDFINKVGRGRIMRLRQAVSYPKLLNTAIEDYNEEIFEDLTDLKNIIRIYDTIEVPAKINYLLKLLKRFNIDHSKVVIWSNFIDTIKLIEKHLSGQDLYCKIIYGNTPIESTSIKDEETREKIRDEFVDPKSGLNFLIANPSVFAESISLHKTCHHAIYYDLSYNCAQYLQSLDRIHRVGGSEKTISNYHFLEYINTIDTDIKKNIDLKTKKMYDIIEEDYAIYSLNISDTEGDEEAYKRIFVKIK